MARMAKKRKRGESAKGKVKGETRDDGDQRGLPGIPNQNEVEGEDVERASPVRLKKVDRRQLLLRTIDVERLISDEHPARAIWEFVGRLDLSGFMAHVNSVEGGAGRPAIDPHLLVSLWVYSYSRGVGSARAIERLCEHDPAYQWLTGMESISAHTLSDFRVAHGESLRELFVQTLGLLSAEGLVPLARVMQDGTRVRANACSGGFRSKERIEEFLEQARDALEAADKEPEEESSRQEQRARERARREKKERLESALKQFDKLKAHKSRVQRASMSDPDARIMKQADGGSAPSYNVQVSTDAAYSVIVGIETTQSGADYRELTPAIERVEQTLDRTPEQVVVDGGYISHANIVSMARRGIELIGPQPRSKSAQANRQKSFRQRGVSPKYESSNFTYDEATKAYVCPEGKFLPYDAKYERNGVMRYRYKASEQDCNKCPVKARCCPHARLGRAIELLEPVPEIQAFRREMQTERAKAIYRTRPEVAEFPNLWIKAKFQLRQFHVRGLAKVNTEALWAALTYDILQWIRLRWKPRTAALPAPA